MTAAEGAVIPWRLSLQALRALATASGIGGWWLMAEAGRWHAPLWFGGLVPLAAWCALVGWWVRPGPLATHREARGDAAVLAGSAACMALSLLALGEGRVPSAWALTALVCAWALWQRALARRIAAVRGAMRDARCTAPASPWALAIGAAGAWWLCFPPGEPTGLTASLAQGGPGPAWAGAWVGVLPLLAAVAVLASGVAARSAAGASTVASAAACRVAPAARASLPIRPRASAPSGALACGRWVMLPMMAGLGSMASLCGATGWSPAGGVAAHLAAMVLPAAVLAAVPTARRAGAAAVAPLMVLGGLALAWLPEASGLMLASLLHGVAWSLATAGHPGASGPGCQATLVSPIGRFATAAGQAAAAGALALGVLAIGAADDRWGPQAWAALHAALAIAAGALLLRPPRPAVSARA